jgi:hypothetical protein
MQSYIISTEYEIVRQEGNTGSIIIKQASLNPANYTVTFKVVTNKGSAVFSKLDAAWTRTTETIGTTLYYVITAYLATTDTTGFTGNHRWELTFTSSTETITVGKGCFEITRKRT